MTARLTALIVSDRTDAAACAVALRLAGAPSGIEPAVVSPSRLSVARWNHVVERDGSTRTTIELSELRLDDESLGAVWFRAPALPVPRFAGAPPAERAYAAAELQALVASWLHAMRGRTVNATDGHRLDGPSWSPCRWLAEARAAGLRVASSARSTRPRPSAAPGGDPRHDRVLVVGSRVFGAGAAARGEACVRLARRAGCRLLEIAFDGGPGSGVAAVDPAAGPASAEEVDATAGLLGELSRAAAQRVAS